MTTPDDQVPPTTPEPPAWEDTRATLGELFRTHTNPAPHAGEITPEAGMQPPVDPAPTEPRDAPPPERAPEPEATTPEPAAVVPAPASSEAAMPAAPDTAAKVSAPPPDAAPATVPPATVPAAAQLADPAPLPLPGPPASPGPAAGFTNDLEEEVFTPTAAPSGPQVGAVVDGYHLNEDLGRGWFTANDVSSGPSLDVYVRPDPLWSELRPHRTLPRTRRVGNVHVLEPVEGDALGVPMAVPVAYRHLTDLARLLYAAEKQGFAVTDLDPAALVVAQDGLKFRFPPRVARLGSVPEPVLREGYTPPEVLAGQAVQANAGVYLLGALLYSWLTGHALPVEGASPAVLGGVTAAGVPQLLNQWLAPAATRPGPAQVLEALKAKTTAPLPAYQVAATTTVGLNPDRPTNEDSYGFTWHQVDADGFPEQQLRAVVSDGMGGMAAGEVASRAAVRAFLNSAAPQITDMVWEANAAVLNGMAGRDGGCTISAVIVQGDGMQLGHVGDSRAYALQGGTLRQISKDHSYVAAMIASGQMTPEEAQHSPDRNKVLRSLGSVRQPQPNYVFTLPEPLQLAPGDRVLLVSDGVWGEVPDATIEALMVQERRPQAVTDRLIELALEAGAPDNATALLIERVK